MTIDRKYLAWGAGVLALVWALLVLRPARRKVRGFDVNGFGSLPVLEGGRVKPLDSLARNSLLVIHSQQSFRYEGRTVGPDEWMLDVLFRPQVADPQPIFVIDDPDVLGLIGAWSRPRTATTPSADLLPTSTRSRSRPRRPSPSRPSSARRFQSAIVNLFERVYLYYQLRTPCSWPDPPGLAGRSRRLGAPDAAQRHQAMASWPTSAPCRPRRARGPRPGRASARPCAAGQGAVHPGLEPLAQLGGLLGQDARHLQPGRGGAPGRDLGPGPTPRRHVRPRDHLQPGPALLRGHVDLRRWPSSCLFVSWIWKPELLRPTAFALLCAGAIVHTAGLVSRIILQGRPPVTNLYSSAVFVGWGAVILGLILERMYRKGFGTAVAAAAGFASLIVAQNLAGDGDTMEMMRAVLDSNFWLATHVVTITIGYSGTFLAGAIAIAYTLRKHFATAVNPETTKALAGHGLRHHLLLPVLQLRGHGAGRHLGRPVLGPVLGLGPQGERRPAHRALERHHPPRPLGRLRPRARHHDHGHLRQHHHQPLLVRREHARRGPALLRLHGQGLLGAVRLRRQPAGPHGARHGPPPVLEGEGGARGRRRGASFQGVIGSVRPEGRTP